jgi:hypothetical protein
LSVSIKDSRFDIFEKLFEERNEEDIFDILYKIIDRRLFYAVNNERLDVLISTHEEDARFFNDYLQKRLNQESENMRYIQSLFPMMNDDNKIRFLKLLNKEQQDYFINIIAENSSVFPISDFLTIENFMNFQYANMGEFELSIFSRYCDLITIKNAGEALLLAKYWYRFAYLGTPEILASVNFFDSYRILDAHILPFVNSDEFLYNLLSIPLEKETQDLISFNINWFAYWLALYLVKKGKNILDKATKKLWNSKKTIIPELILSLIRDLIAKNDFNGGSENYFLYTLFVSANTDNVENEAICKKVYERQQNSVGYYYIYRILYRKSHTQFKENDFLSHLPLDLLIIAIKKELADFAIAFSFIQQNFIENLGDTYETRKKAILEFYHSINSITARDLPHITSLSHKTKDVDSNTTIIPKLEDKILDIFETLYRRVEEENEDSNLELFTFLTFYDHFDEFPFIGLYSLSHNEYKPLRFFSKYSEKKQVIIEKCSKMLAAFSKNPPPEQSDQYDCAVNAAWFLRQQLSFWKGLKPFFTAFRNSKDILVPKNLAPNCGLAASIMYYFSSKDEEKLKKLRQDMANDFADYLKPLKKEQNPRQLEHYTEIERAEQGFALHYTEPRPLWRYAYVRALIDLGVATDGRGHFFQKTLKMIAENDPSETVRNAAEKAAKELNNIRSGFSHHNHKRALCEAFWWLRQAHMLSLGAEIDAAESNKTRVQEWRGRSL